MLALGGLVACTAGQTEQAERRTLKASATTTLTDTSIDNSMTIEAGSLKNTTVDIPSGALAVGTAVDIRRGSAPEDFAISDSTAASSPLVVTATNGSNQLGESQAAMKIAIPLASTGLALMADTSKLVALCKDVYGNLIIWGRDKIAVVDNKAIFQSKRFGTYQLRYIPDADSTDFARTSEEAPAEKTTEPTTSGDDGSSESPSGNEDDGTPPQDPFLVVKGIMAASCAFSSCHSTSSMATGEFLTDPKAFADLKDAIADQVYVQKRMRPKSGDKDKYNKPFPKDGLDFTRPMSPEERYTFAMYLQSIGANLPSDATQPPAPGGGTF